MTAAVPIDGATFKTRLQRLRETWHQDGGLGQVDCVMLTLGTPSDFTVYQRTTAMFCWLLGYEFPETVMVLTRERVAFLTSERKGALLEGLAEGGAVVGEKRETAVQIIKREKEAGQSAAQFEELLRMIKASRPGETIAGNNSPMVVKIGMLTRERNEGAMVEEWMAYLRQRQVEWEAVDVSGALGELLARKDAAELTCIRTAAQLTSVLMGEQAVKRILGAIDSEKRISHAQLAEEIESFVADHLGRLRGKLPSSTAEHLSLEHVELCYPPIIQSGGAYVLKPSAESTDQRLALSGAVLCGVGLRYRAYCSNMVRTLLIGPMGGQERDLIFAQRLQRFLASRLTDGILLGDLYQEGVEYVQRERPDLERHLVSNFGFGIGIEFRESDYLINARSTRRASAGMTFNLVVGLQDLDASSPPSQNASNGRNMQGAPNQPITKYAVMIADTVQVGEKGNEAIFLTGGLEDVREIAFAIKRSALPSPSEPVTSDGNLPPKTIRTRLRTQREKNANAAGGSLLRGGEDPLEKRWKEHQKQLGQQRIKEALERYAAQDPARGKLTQQEALRFESYRKEALLPIKDLLGAPPRIHVDKRNETILLPVFGLAVPFHINTIKNVTKSEEGDFTYLRFNFASPGRTFGRKDALSPLADPTAHFVRGITLRTADTQRAQAIFREIQELRKQAAEKESARKERADLIEQGQLIEAVGRRPVRLCDVYLRPAMEGKRLPGDVEIHSNGLRYRSQLRAEQRVDVLFANVKHFFFQPCDHETLVLVHLHLHHPIMVGRRKTRDIQFYREALESLVDETSGRRSKMRFGDEDEIAQEEEEQRRRAEANSEFRTFAERIVEASKRTLEVDVPFRDLGFTGVPSRQNVLLQPTTDCLVHLTEPPFSVVTLAEVEVAFFERVVFGLKNFDLVFVFQDHNREPVHINSIPMSQLEAVKEWLDSVDVYFVESKVNFNWTNIMKTVNEDPLGFYEMGGWTYLQLDDAQQNDVSEEEASSEYDPDDEEYTVQEEDDEEDEGEEDGEDDEGEDEDDEEYEEDDDDEDQDDEEDDEDDEDDEEDDAPDWDELEEEAKREDERRSTLPQRKRTVTNPTPPPPSKRPSTNTAPAKRR